MPNIVMPAVHLSTDSGTGKIPASGVAAGRWEKTDFTSLLTGLKASSGAAAQAKTQNASPASSVATDVSSPAATPDPNNVLQNAATLTPQASTTPNVKPAGSVRKEAAGKMQTTRQDITAAQAAGIALPAAAAVTVTDPAAAPTIRQTIPAGKIAKSAADFAVRNSQATQRMAAEVTPAQTAPQPNGIAVSGTTAPHLAVTPHTVIKPADIPRQLSMALLANTGKPGANLALHVALSPETLGKIIVKIQHNAAGNANVTITASQPETLETLKKDVANLNQILTNAGMPEANRQLDFQSASVTAAQSSSGLGNAANSTMQGNSSGQQSPQNGMGFASSLPNAASAAVQMPAAIAAPNTSANGRVDMIA